MTETEVRQFIEEKLLALLPSTHLCFANTQVTTPTSFWVRANLEILELRQRELGSGVTRSNWRLLLQLFSRPNSGLGDEYACFEALKLGLGNQRFGSIIVYAPSLRLVGLDAEWHQSHIEILFQTY